jgi:hypothetical protein
MKYFRFLIPVLFIIVTFTLNSCENEPLDGVIVDNTNPDPGVSAGVFKVDFKGATWTSSLNEAVVSDGYIAIASANIKGERFGIYIEGSTPGTYPANINVLAYVPSALSQDGFLGVNENNLNENTGSVTISSINTATKTISGTFNFKGYWSDDTVSTIAPIQFTNGVFKDIPYTTSVPNSGTDTFYAKVDGVEFVEDNIDFAEVAGIGVPVYYSVVGSKLNNNGSIGIKFLKSMDIGSYQVTSAFSDASVYCVFNDVLYNGESGSITITSKTATRISGTFSVVAKNFTTGLTKTISGGTFDVEY